MLLCSSFCSKVSVKFSMDSIRKITIVHKGKSYAVDIDLNDSVETFKLQVYSLTNVPPEGQKIVGFKGGVLKNDADFTKLDVKEVIWTCKHEILFFAFSRRTLLYLGPKNHGSWRIGE